MLAEASLERRARGGLAPGAGRAPTPSRPQLPAGRGSAARSRGTARAARPRPRSGRRRRPGGRGGRGPVDADGRAAPRRSVRAARTRTLGRSAAEASGVIPQVFPGSLEAETRHPAVGRGSPIGSAHAHRVERRRQLRREDDRSGSASGGRGLQRPLVSECRRRRPRDGDGHRRPGHDDDRARHLRAADLHLPPGAAGEPRRRGGAARWAGPASRSASVRPTPP